MTAPAPPAPPSEAAAAPAGSGPAGVPGTLPAAGATPRRHLQPGDLRAVAALATQATAGLMDLVEALHERIARLPGWPAPARAGRTGGITGLAYRSVRGVTTLVGGSAHTLLGWLQPLLAAGADTPLPTPEREAVVAALNGVLGDHLAATGNPLAIRMALRSGGHALPLERTALAAALRAAGTPAGPRVLVLLHGLCMNDLHWQRNGHDHGAMLAREAGWTPLYLHCNTGLAIAENGRLLAALLQQMVQAWPQPIERLALLGHSMGGLIARSAITAAQDAGMDWPRQLGDLVCLGTPHHGAPLERAGRGVDVLLDATPYAAPLARLGRLRSAGITDLRHGSATPLPGGVRCFAVAGVLGEPTAAGGLKRHLKQQWLGDGLVPLDSALGRHADTCRTLAFPAQRQCVVQGAGHLDLLCHAEVAAALQRWLA